MSTSLLTQNALADAELIRTGTPPQIHFTNRQENTTVSNPEEIGVNSRISIIGYVSNYAGASLSVKLGGSPINVMYNSANGTFTGMINMTANNQVVLVFEASNQWGQAIKELHLKHVTTGSGSGSSNGHGSSGGAHGNPNQNGSTGGFSKTNVNSSTGQNVGNKATNNTNKPNPNSSVGQNNGNKPTSNTVKPSPTTVKSPLQKNKEKGDAYFNAKRWSGRHPHFLGE